MAEDIIIQGFGNGGNIPDFATETTLKQLVGVMSKSAGFENLKPEDLQKLANAISKGDGDVSGALKDLKLNNTSGLSKAKVELEKLNDKLLKQIGVEKRSEKERDKDAEESKTLLGNLQKVMQTIKVGLDEEKIDIGEAIGAMAVGIGAVAAPVVAAAGGLVAGIATMSNAYNSFAIELGQTRFDLANQIRQSGLATSLDDATTGMMGFAEMVSENTFTFGQAAAMADKFSMAVGGAGIERSMKFVEQMALGGAEGANMMQRFGLEFGGVINMAGQYMETVRNLGMLDRMNNQQLRSGMEDFMDTVTVTSNVMKINIQDAAEMIASTLSQRDDLTVMLAGLPADLRGTVDSAVAAFGGQGNQFAESIAQYVAAGGMQGFVQTEQGATLQGSAFGQEFLPLLQRIGDQILSGGDLGQILASSEGEIGRLTGLLQDSGFRAQALQGQDQFLTQLGASLLRLQDTIGDADSGNRADTTRPGMADDREFVNRMLVEQRQANAMEKITTALAKSFDYADNLATLNQANLGLINQVEQAAIPAIESVAPRIADATTFVQENLIDLGTKLAAFGALVTRILDGDQSARQEELARDSQQLSDTVNNGTPEEVEARIQAELEATARKIREEMEQVRRETETGDNVTRADRSDSEIERIFESDRDRSIDRYELEDGSTEFRMKAGMNMYTVVPEELANRLMGEREVSREMMSNVDQYEGLSRSVAHQIQQAMFESNNRGEIDAGTLAELLGVNTGVELNTRTSTDEFGNEIQVIDDARFDFLKDMIDRLDARNDGSITREQLDALTNAIDNIDTTGMFKRESTELADASERDFVVVELRRLISALNLN